MTLAKRRTETNTALTLAISVEPGVCDEGAKVENFQGNVFTNNREKRGIGIKRGKIRKFVLDKQLGTQLFKNTARNEGSDTKPFEKLSYYSSKGYYLSLKYSNLISKISKFFKKCLRGYLSSEFQLLPVLQ